MNDALHVAVLDGCPAEVTKEAIVLAEKQQAETLSEREAEIAATVAAYAYSAGRLARYDALVKGQPTLIDLLHRGVHEFFHDEPWAQHDGTDCTDCLTVATLTADLAAAYYVGPYNAVALAELNAGDDVLAGDDEPDDEDDEEIERLSALAEQGYDETQLLPHVPARALHTSVPDEWRDGTGPA